MINSFQYFGGYLRIKVWGFSPERFMNLCSNKNILLWDISRENNQFNMNIGLNNFYRLRPIARKTGVRVVILKRYGLPFFAPVVKKRKVFVAGLFLAVAFWFISSNFIWDIKIDGNSAITDDVLYDFLEEENVRLGRLKRNIDIPQLEKDIRRQFREVTWTSVKLIGIRLQIDIKENDVINPENINDNTDASSILSEYDGIIKSMIVRSGVPVVAVGDEVKKGDLLVDGVIPILNDDATVRKYNFVKADADIIMEHGMEYSTKVPFTHTERVYTGRTTNNYFMRIFDKEIRVPLESPYLVYDSVIKVSRPGLFEIFEIPVYIGKTSYREYMNIEYEYSVSESSDILNEKLNTFIKTLDEKGVQIIEKNVKIDTSGGFWILNADFTVQEKVGRTIRINPDELENLGDTLFNE